MSLGRTPQESRPKTGLPAFFQDANYHDQIVKEQNKPTAIKPTTPQRGHRNCDRLMTCSGRNCHGQRFDSKQNAIAHSLRTGPQPMISVSNAGNHRCLSLALSHRALGNNIDRRWRQSEDHEPSGGNRTKTTSFDGLRQIGRKTSRKLDDLPGSVKRLSGFLCREPYFPRFR